MASFETSKGAESDIAEDMKPFEATVMERAIDRHPGRVIKANKSDIIFGRGKGFQDHPGNKRMRQIVSKYKLQYQTLERGQKRELVEKVYNELIEGGVRFLKRPEDRKGWVEVDAGSAVLKVSHALRCRKSRLEQLHESDALDDRSSVARALTSSSHLTMIPGTAPSSCPLARQRELLRELNFFRHGISNDQASLNGLSQNRALNPGLANLGVRGGISHDQTFLNGLSQNQALNLGLANLGARGGISHDQPFLNGLSQNRALNLGLANLGAQQGISHDQPLLNGLSQNPSLSLGLANLGARQGASNDQPLLSGLSQNRDLNPGLANLEAQRLAALNRYRTLSGITSMSTTVPGAMPVPSSLNLRETHLSQRQLADAYLLDPRRSLAAPPPSARS
jgi:hypothetical protein